MKTKTAMQIDWPYFQIKLGTCVTNYEGVVGAFVQLTVTYQGETREKLMTCDEFSEVTGFDDVRKLMASGTVKGKKRGVA